MCPYETNKDRLESVLDFNDQPEVIPADVEYNAIIGQYISTSETRFDIRWRSPFRP